LIDLDPRFEVARQLAAEQQALRFAREQALPRLPHDVAQAPPLPSTSQVQEIGRGGLIGSRQLGRNLEAMLRERPRTPHEHSVELSSSEPESAPARELPTFVPGTREEFVPWNPHARERQQDAGDLNLSEQNRQRALTQGAPASVTARAAAEMYR
jgi:hypothetical protein